MNPKTIGFKNLAISMPNLNQYKFKTVRDDGITKVKTAKINDITKREVDQKTEKFIAP